MMGLTLQPMTSSEGGTLRATTAQRALGIAGTFVGRVPRGQAVPLKWAARDLVRSEHIAHLPTTPPWMMLVTLPLFWSNFKSFYKYF